jgi:hypothetical protein
MTANEGKIDRRARVVLGGFMLSLAIHDFT